MRDQKLPIRKDRRTKDPTLTCLIGCTIDDGLGAKRLCAVGAVMATDEDMQAGGLQVESADTPGKPEDYLIVNGHRLVSAPTAAGTFR